MKKLESSNIGLQELSKYEMITNNGGSRLGTGILFALGFELLFEGAAKCWQDFQNGFNSVDYSQYY